MSARKDEGKDAGNSGWVTTDVAAEALGVSSRSVRNYIRSGELTALKEKEGISQRYLISIYSLYALRDGRKSAGKVPGNRRRTASRPEASTELVRETAAELLRETLVELETHVALNAELRARLQLTEQAESSVREERDRLLAELEAERRQYADDVERERAERVEAQRRVEQMVSRVEGELEEAERLREELEAERSKGFWARLFGG